jgi:F-type H+-transporting ATPase subunit c
MINDVQTWVSVAAFIGAGLAMGLGAIGAAIGEGYTAAQANTAVSRNPQLSGDVLKSMLVGRQLPNQHRYSRLLSQF